MNLIYENINQKGLVLLFFCLWIVVGMPSISFAQCNTANFTVTKTNGTCFSNGSITVNVPTSTDCTTGGWIAELIKLPSGTPIQKSVPTTGGAITFNALQAGNYSVSLSNGFTTVPFASNPVILTTSYVNMNVSTSSTAPTCRNDAPGYTPNGSLTINVANGTGLGPFLYSVTSSTGTQTFTSSNRSYTFSNMPGAQQVSISVTDLANNDAGCAVMVSQSPTTVSNLSNPMSFDIRGFNYERDCSNATASCNNVKLFVNLSNVNAASLASIRLSGNAKITIAGVDYPLTYVSGSARFKYDPVATGGPQLVNGTVITTTFNGGCNVITQTGTVSMDNTFLTVSPATETVFANCSVRYKFVIIGDRDVNGSTRAAYFCATNSLKFELRNPDGVTFTDVTSTITNSAGVPLSGTNPMGANLGISIPSVSSTWYSNQPGFYRVTASDDCHTIVRTLNVTTTNPFASPVQAVETTSVLEGTSSIYMWFNSLPPLGSPLTMTVRRFDGQTAMIINPTQPLSKAGSYTINFPITRTFNYPTGSYTISDLPLGRYIVEVTNSCSSTTGLKGTYDITLVKPTSYNPVFSVTNSCTGSNTINYNMNPVNAKTTPYTVKLYTNNGSGGLGALVSTSTSNTLSGSFINLNSGNYIVSFENVTPVDNTSWFSPAFNSSVAQTYTKAITIEPYTDITISTSTAVCNVNDSNSGIINAQVSSGTIVYPMSFTLYDASNLSTPVQAPISVISPIANHTFTGLALGNYVVKVTNPCYSVNSNVTVNNSSAVPSAQVSNTVVCPNSPTTIAIISATNNLYDITWKDNNNVVVGTGMPVTLSAAVTTTYTAFYALKSTFGCPNTITNQSNVTVTVTPNPDLTLAVSDINLCDGTSPSITISNTQSEFTYEIVNSSGTSFSPALTASGNGGSLNIPIPNTITLVGGQVLKIKATNGNAGCSGILNDFSNVILDTPSKPMPSATSKSNVCPATTVDLTTLQPTAVSGITYEWHTVASNPTVGTLVSTPSGVAVGTYYLYGKSANGCYSAASSAVTATLTPDNTVSAASSSPILCINTALTNITHTTTGATGIGTATGLPAGVTVAWAANTITISGTPTASGTFTYSIPLTGGCGTVNATGTITVTPSNTVSAASSSPTLCNNTALTNITHTTRGATGIGTATGLPAGVTAAWVVNTITISGTPTASGTFTYSIPLTGGCGTVNATGTITVTAVKSVSAASSTPTLCINTALTNITHTTTGATGIGTATGLPAGVTAAWAGDTITISGTPTASGTFTYSIPLTVGCGTVDATGTITVTAVNTVSAASSTPTLCVNTALTNITHTTTGATGIGMATGLPAGVIAAWAGNMITISGTPTASGTFTYSIPLTGGCGTVNATGMFTVTAANTVFAASTTPTLCISTALTNITHTTTGAIGIGTATGLPAGVIAAWAGNMITISGTPTASGTFTYSIPLTFGCGTVNATGTITVTAVNTVSAASSTPTLCVNTALTNITHTTTGATGIGTATGLPAGVTAAWGANTITISGTSTASGTFTYSIPLTGGCGTVNATGMIKVNATPSTPVPKATSKSNICPATMVDLTTLQPTAVSGVTYEWHTVASNPTSGTLVSTPSSVPAGTYYLYSKSASGCYSAASSAVTATEATCCPTVTNTESDNVNPTSCASATGSIKLCGLTANGTGYTINYDKNGIVATAVMNQTADASGCITLTGLTSGSYTNIKISSTACPTGSNALSASLTDPTAPSAPIGLVGVPSSVCKGTSVALSATATAGATYTWTVVPTGATLASVAGTVLGTTASNSLNSTAAGTYTVSLTQTVLGCTSAPATTTITVNATPSTPVPTATSKSNVCPATTVDLTTLQPTVVSGVTYEWHTVASNPTSGTLVSTPSSVPAGTYYLYSKSAGGCYSAASSAVTATEATCCPTVTNTESNNVNPTSCASATGSIKLCGLTANGTGYTINYDKNGIVATAVMNQTADASGCITLTGLTSGSYTNIKISSTACPTGSNALSASLTDPTAPSAPIGLVGVLSSVCKGTSVALSATGIAGATYTWTVAPTGAALSSVVGTVSGTTASNSLNSTAAGTYTVSLTQTVSGCTSATAITTITVNATPSTPLPTATSKSNVCPAATVDLTTLQPTVVSGVTYEWHTVASNPTSGTLVSTPSSVPAGTYYLYSKSASGCYSAASSAVIATVATCCPTITNVGVNNTNPTTCSGSNGSIKLCGLTANASGYTVNYDKNSVAATALTNQTADASGCISIAGLTAGSYTNIKISSTACPARSNALSAILTDPTAPSAPTSLLGVPSSNICIGTIVSLSATGIAGATYTWTVAPTGATLSSVVGTVSGTTASNSLNSTAAGTYTVSLTQTVSGCTSAPATTTITVNATPSTVVPTATSKSNVCPASTVDLTTLQPTAVSGVTYEWHTVASNPTSGTLVSTPSSLTAGTYYLYGKSSSGCYSAASSAIIATVATCCPTITNVGVNNTNPTTCSGSNGSIKLCGLMANGTGYTVNYDKNGVAATALTNQTADASGCITLTGLNAGSYTNIKISNVGCNSNSISATLSDLPNLNAPISGGDHTTTCVGVAIPAISASVGTNETVDWYDALTAGNLLASATTSYQATQAGTYYAEARTMITGCKSAIRTAVTIKVNNLPSLIVGEPICSLDNSNYFLSFNSNGIVSSTAGTVSGNNVTGILAGTNVVLTATSSAGCKATKSVNAPRCTNCILNVSADASSISQGQTTILHASGCNGGYFVWENTGKVGRDITVQPFITTTYKATCSFTSGVVQCAAEIAISVSPCQLSASASSERITQGESVTLSASGCPNGYLIWAGTNLESSTITVAPYVTTTYMAKCWYATGNGTGNESCSISKTITVTPCKLSATASSENINQGESVTLSASGCPNGYLIWAGTHSESATITVTPYVTTTYTAKCWYATGNGTGNESCSISKTIMVNPCQLSATISSENITQGESVTLSASGCKNGYLIWAGTHSESPTITVTPYVTTTYTAKCWYATGNGTGNESCSISKTITVAQCQLSATASSEKITKGESIILSASGCKNGYLIWAGTNSESSTIIVRPSETTTYTVKCWYATGNGNGNESCSISKTIYVTPCNLKTAVDKLNLTLGESFTMTSTGCNGKLIYPQDTTQNGKSVFTYLPKKTQDFIIQCNIGNIISCDTTIPISVEPCHLSATAQKASLTLGESLYITSMGCIGTLIYPQDTTQNGKSVFTYLPKKTQDFIIQCKIGNIISCDTIIPIGVEPCHLSATAQKASLTLGESLYITSTGCIGTLIYPDDTTQNGKSVFIFVPKKTQVFTIQCKVGTIISCDTTIQITVEPCHLQARAEKATLIGGEVLKIISTGCIGELIYPQDTSQSGKSVFTYLPSKTQVYIIQCKVGNIISCDTTINVVVDKCPSVIQATATTIIKGDFTTLSYQGCPNTVVWKDLGVGTSKNVSPSKTMIYYASCNYGDKLQYSCSSDSIIIKVRPKQPLIDDKRSGAYGIAIQDTICINTNLVLIVNCEVDAKAYWNGKQLNELTVDAMQAGIQTYRFYCQNADGDKSDESTAQIVVKGFEVEDAIIYPVPTVGLLHIKTKGCLDNLRLTLFTLSGQVLYQGNGEGRTSESISIDLTFLPANEYVLHISGMQGKEPMTKRVRIIKYSK